MAAERACRECGCTQNHACVTAGVACHWVEPDLCSACADPAAAGETAAWPPVGRRWLPAAWLDEMNPTMLNSPDSYIERAGDAWTLRLPAGDDERDSEFYRMTVEPGQIVEFMWTEHHGDRQLTIAADRTFSIDAPVPEGTTHFYDYESGAIADSLAELVEGDEALGQLPLDAGVVAISTYTWSDAIPFRFEVDADGAGRFAPSAGAN